MVKRRRSPPEKKVLSYARDRRNTYAENSKSSRTSIRLRKRLRSRADRRVVASATKVVSKSQPDEFDVSRKRPLAAKYRYWRKDPDTPLGVVVARKLARRKAKSPHGV